MTEDKLKALFKLWQGRLGLNLWDITIKVEPFGDDDNSVIMSCGQSKNYETAIIKVQPWALTEKPPSTWMGNSGIFVKHQVEKSVVHELLHCVLKRLAHWEDLVGGQLHRDVASVVQEAHDQATEATVDALAVALVRAFGQSK